MDELNENIDPVNEVSSNEVVKANDDFVKFVQFLLKFYYRAKKIVKKYLWLFIVLFLIGIGATTNFILNKEKTYAASIMFVLKDDDASSTQYNSLADPLSSLLLNRTTSQSVNIDRLTEVVNSQKLLSNILYNKCIIGGKEDFLINHFLKIYYGVTGSYFSNYSGLNSLDRNKYKVFLQVFILVRNSITIEQTKSGAFVMRIKTIDEELSKVSSELLYQNLSNFYIDKTTEKAQRNYVFLRNRLDSIRNMLYSSEYQVANFEDRSRNLLLNTARVPQFRQRRNTIFYENLYLEVLKLFETSKVTLNNITPIFQILSRPYYPLTISTRSNLMIVLIGLIVSSVVLFLVLILIYLKIYIWPDYKHLFQYKDKDI
ncbi:MAG: hypothetical protein LC105_05065 [Chitinophagales bacterium]|nr:hypothetical protein [Chitinophagales bacterium]MCZ2393206.1 hypothetical protein [Chitinophagales bacterium]